MIKLQDNVSQDGNVFYIFNRNVEQNNENLLYCVEMNVRVPDLDLKAAERARRYFAQFFPQHVKP